MQGPIGAILGILITAPFVLVGDWFAFLSRLEPRQRELTKASHGTMMMVAAYIGYQRLHAAIYFSFDEQHLLDCFCYFIALWGLFWIFTGGMRSRGQYDFHLMGRALAKMLVPMAFLYYGTRYSYHWDYEYRWWFLAIAPYPVLWCAITGGAKFLLLCLPPPRMRLPAVGHMPYGDSSFTIGSNLE